MSLEFVKMHGLGNDFVLVQGTRSDFSLEWVKKVCAPHFGVGADGVLFYSVAPPRMEVVNADGSAPEMCGNGLRCVARWLNHRHGLPGTFVIQTDAGAKLCTVNPDGQVRIEMGEARIRELTTRVGQVTLDGLFVDMGNPHFVVFSHAGDLDELGKALNDGHPDFPNGVNLEFVDSQSQERLVVRVWERGVGLTLACGTGACASAAATWHMRGTHAPLEVELPGGILQIEHSGGQVLMTGPTQIVYTGALSASFNMEVEE